MSTTATTPPPASASCALPPGMFTPRPKPLRQPCKQCGREFISLYPAAHTCDTCVDLNRTRAWSTAKRDEDFARRVAGTVKHVTPKRYRDTEPHKKIPAELNTDWSYPKTVSLLATSAEDARWFIYAAARREIGLGHIADLLVVHARDIATAITSGKFSRVATMKRCQVLAVLDLHAGRPPGRAEPLIAALFAMRARMHKFTIWTTPLSPADIPPGKLHDTLTEIELSQP